MTTRIGTTGVGTPRMEQGALCLAGRRRLLRCGEYPYYRDDPDMWPPKLAAIRAAGLTAVSFYVPWRHHETGAGGFRFDGPGNRDLSGFLAAVGRAGLLAVPKPGPFVHAELPLGGLPDRVAPGGRRGRAAAVSATGEPVRYLGAALPSPADPGYRRQVAAWLAAVGAALRPWLYPRGPVVAVQVGNEGWHGESAVPIDAQDYADATTEAFRRSTGGLEPPRSWVAPLVPADLAPYLAWGEWAGRALREGLRELAGWLDLAVPAIANLAPPARADRSPVRAAERYDAWYVRGLDADTAVHYGYTSWVGDAARDDEALLNYVLAASRGRGCNLEENWSLGWADPSAPVPATSIYHGLLGLACGATGLTVYTACATAHWGPHLRLPAGTGSPWRDPPYGEAAPIGPDGAPGPGYPALTVLTHFLAGVEADLLGSVPPPGLRWCGYRPYAALGAWQAAAGTMAGTVAGQPAPPTVAGSLLPLLARCLHHRVPLALADLPTGAGASPPPRPEGGPVVAPAGFFLSAAAQAQLAGVLAGGARLLLVGELPALDERFRPCRVLAEQVRRAGGQGRVAVAAPGPGLPDRLDRWLTAQSGLDPGPPPSGPALGVLELRRADPTGGTFVFLFSRRDHPQRVRTTVAGAELAVRLGGYGCAVVRVSDGRVAACYVRNVDERAGTGEPVEVCYGRERIATTGPGEVSVVAGRDGYATRHAGAGRLLLPAAAMRRGEPWLAR